METPVQGARWPTRETGELVRRRLSLDQSPSWFYQVHASTGWGIHTVVGDEAAKGKEMRHEEDDQRQLAEIRTYSGGKWQDAAEKTSPGKDADIKTIG